MDVVPLDGHIVRGSHGLSAANLDDKPILIGHGVRPAGSSLPMAAVRDLVLQALGPG